MTYAGRRVVDGQTLALLRAGGEILVMQVRPDQVAWLGRFETGQAVKVRNGKLVPPRRANTAQQPDNTVISEGGKDRGSPSRKTRSTR